MITQQLVRANDSIYLEHILHGQIETKAFWLEQMAEWETDLAGNTPFMQFDLILAVVTVYEYVRYLFNTGVSQIEVNCIEFGGGIISDVDEINSLVTCVFSSRKTNVFSREKFIKRQWTINY